MESLRNNQGYILRQKENSMKIYFSTFTTGAQEIIKKFLQKRKVRIKLLLDGLVVYESNLSLQEIRNFRLFNNSFILLSSFSNLPPSVKSLEKMLKSLANTSRLSQKIVSNLPSRRRNFKIVTSLENRMVAVNRFFLEKLEKLILKTGKVKLNIKKPDLEFWLLLRREGYGFFGIKITYPLKKERPQKGKLSRQIAYMMALLSKPNPKDIVIDPFAGYGSLPIERAASFPYQQIIAVDKNKHLVANLKKKVKKMRKRIKVIQGDALTLEEINDKAIDKIISDPPWGEFEKIENIEKFYESMLKEFDRILKPKGIAVLLIGTKESFENILIDRFKKAFLLEKKYDILVSGKKAAIYKLVKINEGYENKNK